MKIHDLLREFKQYALLEKGMTPRVHRSIAYTLEMLTKFTGCCSTSELQPEAIRSFFYYGREERGWAPKTYRNYWQYLKTFFDFCLIRGYVTRNPVLSIGRPKLPERLPRCLSSSDAAKVLYGSFTHPWQTEFQRVRNHAIVATLLMTGLRLQELLNLEMSDLDLEGGGLWVRKGKGGKDRLVPIHPRLHPILRRYLNDKQNWAEPSRWLFTGLKSGKQLTQKDIRRICTRVGKAVGVKFTPHMLRHTLGRELSDQGVSPRVAQRIFGHAQITTTQIYSHLSTQAYRESFQKAKIF